MNYTGGATSFRRILARMGYKNLSQKGTVVKSQDSSFGTGINITQSSGVTFTTGSGITFSPDVKIEKKVPTTSDDQQTCGFLYNIQVLLLKVLRFAIHNSSCYL